MPTPTAVIINQAVDEYWNRCEDENMRYTDTTRFTPRELREYTDMIRMPRELWKRNGLNEDVFYETRKLRYDINEGQRYAIACRIAEREFIHIDDRIFRILYGRHIEYAIKEFTDGNVEMGYYLPIKRLIEYMEECDFDFEYFCELAKQENNGLDWTRIL